MCSISIVQSSTNKVSKAYISDLPSTSGQKADTNPLKLLPKKPACLIPNRRIACDFRKLEVIENENVFKLDEVCHKRAFSKSVIRIPYLTWGRISEHQLTDTPKHSPVKPHKQKKNKNVSCKVKLLKSTRKTSPQVK